MLGSMWQMMYLEWCRGAFLLRRVCHFGGMSDLIPPALFFVAVAIHNAEEAIRFPAWSTRLRRAPRVTPRAFVWASQWVTVWLALIWIVSGAGGMRGAAVAMIANLFVPHLPVSLVTRSLAPGLVTSALFVCPAGILLLAHTGGWPTGTDYALAALFSLCALAPLGVFMLRHSHD